MRGSSFPSALLLFESQAQTGEWQTEASLIFQGNGDFTDTGFDFNQLSMTRYLEEDEIKIGKFVTSVGVLDYLSLANVLNPVRAQFFDDANPNIRRIPLWMVQGTLSPADETTFRFFIEPFDSRYQDYTSTYLSIALDRLLPQYFSSYNLDDETLEVIRNEIFLPAYTQGIAPSIKRKVGNYYSFDNFTLDKTMIGFDYTHADFDTMVGVNWFNKYSEVPFIEVDPDLIALIQNEGDAAEHIKEYLDQNDLSVVKSVEGFRYNQVSIYGEGAFSEYGMRFEATYRDKIPLIDDFSALFMVGAGIDHSGASSYNDFELQWIYLDESGQNIFATIWVYKYPPFFLNGISIRPENYTMYGATEGAHQISFLPNLTFDYREHLQLRIQYLFYPDDAYYNTFMATLGVRF
ncbi:hypothetical protein HCR_20260 [Hydrogenimonas cancrithermarum]|uniref:Porin n=1 Tax=Hydrogenimonas cancrithermarum TaxID=2993563 RepID=A0ABN6WWY3_9BACT|nr:hypothetical protein HCR_20260 [Hydrogenimonas cancrithermarum]